MWRSTAARVAEAFQPRLSHEEQLQVCLRVRVRRRKRVFLGRPRQTRRYRVAVDILQRLDQLNLVPYDAIIEAALPEGSPSSLCGVHNPSGVSLDTLHYFGDSLVPSRDKNRVQVIGQHGVTEKVSAITAHELESFDNHPSVRRVSEKRGGSPRAGGDVVAVALKHES